MRTKTTTGPPAVEHWVPLALVVADRRRRAARDDRGAVLILALIYIVAVSFIVGALADWAMNDLNNTTTFDSVSQLHYALSGATEAAIHDVRFSPIPSIPPSNGTASPITECLGGSTSISINGYNVAVYCSTVINLAQAATRTVTFYACQWTSSTNATSCASSAHLTVVVAYDDYPAVGGLLLTQQCNLVVPATPCGYGQTIEQWVWK